MHLALWQAIKSPFKGVRVNDRTVIVECHLKVITENTNPTHTTKSKELTKCSFFDEFMMLSYGFSHFIISKILVQNENNVLSAHVCHCRQHLAASVHICDIFGLCCAQAINVIIISFLETRVCITFVLSVTIAASAIKQTVFGNWRTEE